MVCPDMLSYSRYEDTPERRKRPLQLRFTLEQVTGSSKQAGRGWLPASNDGAGPHYSVNWFLTCAVLGWGVELAAAALLAVEICHTGRFSPGHIRRAILKLVACSFLFSMHFFFQIIPWLCNRTDYKYHFSKHTHLMTSQIKWQWRLLAGKRLTTSTLFLLCVSVVMTISEDTGLKSNSYTA